MDIDLTPGHPRYPHRLAALPNPPSFVSVSGTFDGAPPPAPTIAIVGTREPEPEAARFARELAGAFAGAGAVVVSGGALGIDTAAHEGALDAGGVTWAVAGHGREHLFPPQNATLFARIATAGGAMIWPFSPDVRQAPLRFLQRNAVLVALADAVVMVQAAIPSGALNAASWARRLGRPLWVVPAPPWRTDYAGNLRELAAGALPLFAPSALFASMQLVPPRSSPLFARPSPSARRPPPRLAPHAARPPLAALPPPRTPPPLPGRATTAHALPDAELLALPALPSLPPLLDLLDAMPAHADAIALRAGIPPTAAAATLLLLSLSGAADEGPPGFFRRAAR